MKNKKKNKTTNKEQTRYLPVLGFDTKNNILKVSLVTYFFNRKKEYKRFMDKESFIMRVIETDNIIVFLFKLGDLEWTGDIFSLYLVDENIHLDKFKNGDGFKLRFCIMEYNKNKTIQLSTQFSNTLVDKINRCQDKYSDEDLMRICDMTFDELAKLPCEEFKFKKK